MKNTYTTLLTTSILIVACMLLSCNAGSIRSQQRDQVRPNVLKKGSVAKDSFLSADKVKDVSLKEPTDLTAVQFLDDNNGWIGGKEKLFKTQDGGRTWQPVKLEVLPGSSVRRINFISPSVGWIILQRSGDLAVNYQLNRFWVLHTADGGNTWSLQYDGNEAALTALLFTDEKNGWITGIKYGGLSPYRYTYLVLHTSDQGAHWQDASQELIKLTAAAKQEKGDRINAAIMGVAAAEPTGIRVITSENEVFTTSDEARSWKGPVVIDNKSEQAGIRRFGSNVDNKLWFLTSTHGMEGTGSTLAVEQNQDSWSSFTLHGIYLSDAVSLSDRRFVASGFEVNGDKDDPSDTHAVLLYTPDDGQTWSIIYRNKSVPEINSLNVLKPGVITAVGRNGSVFRLQIDSLQ